MRASGRGTDCAASVTRCTRRSGATDGDDIDWDAYRTLVRYCVGDLGHEMLWCTSGLAEFWALTLDERKRLLEVAIEEARAINPDVVIQACTSATAAKDCLDLTRHAQEAGADIVYIQTPVMETHGGEGVLNFFRYIADRTDIALGMFNSPSSGYVLTAEESARIAAEIPAVCATKEGAFRPANSRRLHELAPDLLIWECDTDGLPGRLAARRHRLRRAAGHGGLPVRDAARRLFTEYWNLIWDGKLIEAMDYAHATGMDQIRARPGLLVHLLSGPPGLLHPLGWRVQVRRVGARSADRRLPALAPAAGGSARGREDADPRGLRASRAGR